MDKSTLSQILLEELNDYVGRGANVVVLPVYDHERHTYALATVDYPKRQHPADIAILTRLVDNFVVIDEDLTDKKLVDALLHRGIPREQIVLVYEGETAPDYQLS